MVKWLRKCLQRLESINFEPVGWAIECFGWGFGMIAPTSKWIGWVFILLGVLIIVYSRKKHTRFKAFSSWAETQIDEVTVFRNQGIFDTQALSRWNDKLIGGVRTAWGDQEANQLASSLTPDVYALILYAKTSPTLHNNKTVDNILAALIFWKRNLTANGLLPNFESADLERF